MAFRGSNTILSIFNMLEAKLMHDTSKTSLSDIRTLACDRDTYYPRCFNNPRHSYTNILLAENSAEMYPCCYILVNN